jgi:hypothetical protein
MAAPQKKSFANKLHTVGLSVEMTQRNPVADEQLL